MLPRGVLNTLQDNDYFLGGLGLTGTALFNWHPVLMVSGMIVAFTQGETNTYSSLRGARFSNSLPTAVAESFLLLHVCKSSCVGGLSNQIHNCLPTFGTSDAAQRTTSKCSCFFCFCGCAGDPDFSP